MTEAEQVGALIALLVLIAIISVAWGWLDGKNRRH